MNPDHTTNPISLISISIISSYLCLGVCGLPTKNLYALLFSPLRATYHAHLILLDLIILITFGEDKSYQTISIVLVIK
jgi:hypothetical protein